MAINISTDRTVSCGNLGHVKFSEVIGQVAVKEQFRNLVSGNRIPHALLLLGSPGSGDLSMGLALSQYILCDNRTENDSCGVCPNCIKAEKLIHPDIHYSFPTVGTNVMSDDQLQDWRSAVLENPYLDINQWLQKVGAENKQGNINARECGNIIKKLSLKTFESPFKVLVIWLPEYLGKEGNRLLKLIEEPPDNTIIILVAQNVELILNTIISRCQIIKLAALSDEEVAAGIQSRSSISKVKALKLAQIADGNFNEAINLAESPENDNSSQFLDWLRKCYEGNGVNMVAWVENFSGHGRENQKQFLQYGLYFLQEFLRLKILTGVDTRFLPSELESAKKLDNFLGFGQVEKLVRLFDDCYYHIERNAHQKLLFLNASIHINRIFREK